MRAYDLIGGCVWLFLSVLVILGSIQLELGSLASPGAGLFPLLSGIILGILSLLLIADPAVKADRSGETETVVWSRETRWKYLIITLFSLIFYALLLNKLGFIPTTFLFMVLLFRAIEPQKWIRCVVSAGLVVLCSWIIFQVWLQSQLPEGIIWSYFRNLL